MERLKSTHYLSWKRGGANEGLYFQHPMMAMAKFGVVTVHKTLSRYYLAISRQATHCRRWQLCQASWGRRSRSQLLDNGSAARWRRSQNDCFVAICRVLQAQLPHACLSQFSLHVFITKFAPVHANTSVRAGTPADRWVHACLWGHMGVSQKSCLRHKLIHLHLR